MQIARIPARRLLEWLDVFDSCDHSYRKWAWIDKDNQRAFAPLHPTPHLYRGQVKRYAPCRSSICRDIRSIGASFAEFERDDAFVVLRRLAVSHWFVDELKMHPFFQMAKTNQWYINPLAIAQHYGVPTAYLDLTEALDVAMFFATCKFDGTKWIPATEGEGILYRMDWDSAPRALKRRGEAIGFQPFTRPYEQWAWTLTLTIQDFEEMDVHATIFEHCPSVGETMLRRFAGGERLFPPDPLAVVADRAVNAVTIPRKFVLSAAQDAAEELREIPDRIMEEMLQRNMLSVTDDHLTLWRPEEIAEAQTVSLAEIARYEDDIARSTVLFLVKKDIERENAG